MVSLPVVAFRREQTDVVRREWLRLRRVVALWRAQAHLRVGYRVDTFVDQRPYVELHEHGVDEAARGADDVRIEERLPYAVFGHQAAWHHRAEYKAEASDCVNDADRLSLLIPFTQLGNTASVVWQAWLLRKLPSKHVAVERLMNSWERGSIQESERGDRRLHNFRFWFFSG